MITLTAPQLLAVWEQGQRRHPLDRGLLLHALAEPERPVETLADLPLGVRNAALLRFRQACFGPELRAWLDCPACGERMEFELDPNQWPAPPEAPEAPITVQGHRFRRPGSRQLAELAGLTDEDQAARQLLRACALEPEALPRETAALTDLLDAVDASLDTQDPCADLALTLHCPACDHAGSAGFDIAGYLWEELDSQARRLLDEVHALAQAYGWREPDILALSDTRRAAYLARVTP